MKPIVAVGILTAAIASPSAFATDNWDFSVQVYGQGTNIDGDVKLNNKEAPVDLDFSDILDTLDMGAMFHAEAFNKASGWGVGTDYAYMDLRESANIPAGSIGNTNDVTANAGVRQGVFEGFVFKRMAFGKGSIDYLLGGRHWDNNIVLGTDETGSLRIDEDWTDVFAGVRFIQPITHNVNLIARADAGGFGLESDSTYSAYLGAEWLASDNLSVNLKYKSTWVDYKGDAELTGGDYLAEFAGSTSIPGTFVYDTASHGITAGVTFKF